MHVRGVGRGRAIAVLRLVVLAAIRFSDAADPAAGSDPPDTKSTPIVLALTLVVAWLGLLERRR